MRTDSVPAPQTVAPEAAQETRERTSTRRAEILIGAGVVLLGVIALVLVSQLSSARDSGEFGARWWPTVMAGALVVLGLAIAVSGGLKPPAVEVDPVRRQGVLRLTAVLGLIVAYGWAWYQMHFLVVTPALLVGLMLVLGHRGWKHLILTPAIITAALYGVFGMLLRVPL
ncbi:tripartite tricarboxylate transporter TctB family protein [Nesterenkonia flava]|uniref:Tripartite tricarboxylate transporter TctB family protein n=1 Tax=Nesterenkonia flava TaxID=469799 RepID=A0ABU1FVG0_9MICC|nr:tripartite tricarboxylate transporter TctB family protein [Nesterenkonia flava]MDR5712660.1 tripartite tricarboxylate transporter TctB family protein [Nesterenkonia flava]